MVYQIFLVSLINCFCKTIRIFTKVEKIQYLLCIRNEFLFKVPYPCCTATEQYGFFVSTITVAHCKRQKMFLTFLCTSNMAYIFTSVLSSPFCSIRTWVEGMMPSMKLVGSKPHELFGHPAVMLYDICVVL